MFALLLKFHANSVEILFDLKEEAQAALDALKPKMGERYGRNEELTHTIATPQGDFVVVISKLESAAVIDIAKNHADGLLARKATDDADIDFAARKAAAIEAAKAKIGAVA